MGQIFLSHTKQDKDFCDYFDSICARVGIQAFRSEFETIEPPAWATIRSKMRFSSAMFLLVGNQLTMKQASHGQEWEYTQNWIAYEIGLASQLNIPVWVYVDDNASINFPVPYVTDYIFGDRDNLRGYLRGILSYYNLPIRLAAHPGNGLQLNCPYTDCALVFRFHVAMPKYGCFKCPHCLREITLKEEWPPPKQPRIISGDISEATKITREFLAHEIAFSISTRDVTNQVAIL